MLIGKKSGLTKEETKEYNRKCTNLLIELTHEQRREMMYYVQDLQEHEKNDERLTIILQVLINLYSIYEYSLTEELMNKVRLLSTKKNTKKEEEAYLKKILLSIPSKHLNTIKLYILMKNIDGMNKEQEQNIIRLIEDMS